MPKSVDDVISGQVLEWPFEASDRGHPVVDLDLGDPDLAARVFATAPIDPEKGSFFREPEGRRPALHQHEVLIWGLVMAIGNLRTPSAARIIGLECWLPTVE